MVIAQGGKFGRGNKRFFRHFELASPIRLPDQLSSAGLANPRAASPSGTATGEVPRCMLLLRRVHFPSLNHGKHRNPRKESKNATLPLSPLQAPYADLRQWPCRRVPPPPVSWQSQLFDCFISLIGLFMRFAPLRENHTFCLRASLPPLFGSPGGRYGQVNPVASFSVPTSPSIPQSPIHNPECLPRYKRVSVPSSPTASSRTTMQQQRVRIRLQAYEVL